MAVSDAPTLTVAVVGDIHDQWDFDDHQALRAIAVDLVLFVGDFGNESLAVVEKIAGLALPKATIFGNHDGWYTATDWGRKKSPYDHRLEDRVRAQQALLGAEDVSYGRQDFAPWLLSVVGGRPFTWGGQDWKTGPFLQERYGIRDMAHSQARITQTALDSPYDTLIFLGHNGPTGLGRDPESLCGRDWQPLGGDWGDPDLAGAIATVRRQGKRIPLVTFGHMHHRLRHRQDRLRERVAQDAHGTVYLNAACVPRVHDHHGDRLRNFSVVTLQNGQVAQIDLLWVNPQGEIPVQERLFTRS